jgi:hypothetical protein
MILNQKIYQFIRVLPYFIPYLLLIINTENHDWNARLATSKNSEVFLNLLQEPALNVSIIIFDNIFNNYYSVWYFYSYVIIFIMLHYLDKIHINHFGKFFVIFNPVMFYLVTNIQGQAIATLGVVGAIFMSRAKFLIFIAPFFHIIGLFAWLSYLYTINIKLVYGLLTAGLFFIFFNTGWQFYVDMYYELILNKVNAYQEYSTNIYSRVFHGLILFISGVTFIVSKKSSSYWIYMALLCSLAFIIYDGKLSQRVLMTISAILIFYTVSNYSIFKKSISSVPLKKV